MGRRRPALAARLATLRFAALVVLFTAPLAACDDDRTQVCVPGRTDRCPEGETCNVDGTGTPRCIPPGDAAEGALCHVAAPGDTAADPAGRCAEGLGCLRVAGVSRCLRFCDPTARKNPCRPDQIGVGPGGVDLADFATCAAVLPDRAEIGVCVLPCRPERRLDCDPGDAPEDCTAYPADCPDETTCGVAPAAPFPVCVPRGDVTLDRPCDAAAPCAAGLLCARLDGAAACRLPVDVADGCPDGLTARPLAGTADEFALDSTQQVCLP